MTPRISPRRASCLPSPPPATLHRDEPSSVAGRFAGAPLRGAIGARPDRTPIVARDRLAFAPALDRRRRVAGQRDRARARPRAGCDAAARVRPRAGGLVAELAGATAGVRRRSPG